MPDQNESQQNELQLTKEAAQEFAEQTSGILRNGFKLFTDHFNKMTEDSKKFDAEYEKVKEEIEPGGKRTSGRIL